MSASQPIQETPQDAGAHPPLSPPDGGGATHCQPEITNDLGAAMALGFTLAVIEPTEAPSPVRWVVPGANGEAVGSGFAARVLRARTQNGARLPDVIEVHQWDAVAYARGRPRLEPTDDTPGHATPRAARRLLALLHPDGMGTTQGWRLVRSWHLRDDETIEGAALGQRVDAPAATVFDAFTARAARGHSALTDAGIGGAR